MFFDIEIDQDSISDHSSDSEGLVLEKDNIDIQNFANEKYRAILQESTMTHFAMQEERSHLEHSIQAINEKIEGLKDEIEEAKKKWVQEERQNGCHITVIAPAENMTSEIFLSYNKAFLDVIDNIATTPMRSLKVKSIGNVTYLNNCLKWVMYHLSQGSRNNDNPENHVGITCSINITSLELLDLSYCKGIDLKALATNAPIFQSLTSLIIQKCGLTYEDTQHLIKLFDKLPNLIYLDVKNNKLDLIKLIDAVERLPDLSYLLVDGNPKPQCFMEEVRKLGLHI
jgi:hypothetical protein